MSPTAFAAIGLALLAADRAARSDALLAAAPLGCLAITPDGAPDGDRVHGHAALMAALGLDGQQDAALSAGPEAFEAAGAKLLSMALAALRDQGRAFELRLPCKDGGRILEVRGARAQATRDAEAVQGAGTEILWFHDVTELVREMERIRAEGDGFKALLDGLPLPVWRRDPELNLVYCNRAYGRAVDAEPAAALTGAI